jgi:hypothetical protein
VPFHGDDQFPAKDIERIEKVYRLMAEREKNGKTLNDVNYGDMLLISVLINSLNGNTRFMDDSKAASPLFSLVEINKVLNGQVDILNEIVTTYKHNLRVATNQKVSIEPFDRATSTLLKILFFVNEAILHMTKIMPTHSEYSLTHMVKLNLDKARTEHEYRKDKKI